MKKIIFISVLAVTTVFASAQSSKFRLNVYGSYVFDDGFDVYNDANTYYNGKIKAGFQWGGGIEYATTDYSSVELMYLNKSADVPTTFKFAAAQPVTKETFDLTQHYILLAFNGLKQTSGKVEGYASLMGGVLISDVTSPTKQKSGSNTDFAWGARLGANIWASKKVGIKLQAQILNSAKATGGDTYWGYWGPVYLNTYTAIWQFGLGGGLTFKLGN